MMLLRLCGKRFSRVPESVTVDGGPDFRSIYFDCFLAMFRIRKHLRPRSEPRFGSVQERLGLTLNTELIYTLLGNTQATKNPRMMSKATDPRRLTEWTLPELADAIRYWADEIYDTRSHPALNLLSPREAYEQSIERDGLREHKIVTYNSDFIRETFPSTRTGTAMVKSPDGVRIRNVDYWCEEMRVDDIQKTLVPVRYDPFDRNAASAYILGDWRDCTSSFNEFVGCSERELQLISEEMRQVARIQHGRSRIEVSQQELAEYRRRPTPSNAVQEQQLKDQDTKLALAVLEGQTTVSSTQPTVLPDSQNAQPAERAESPTRSVDEKSDLSKLVRFRKHSTGTMKAINGLNQPG